jgi:hypothetical protein
MPFENIKLNDGNEVGSAVEALEVTQIDFRAVLVSRFQPSLLGQAQLVKIRMLRNMSLKHWR